ncbi:hypothetical protein [Xanthocytophaga agilis]|uniref:Uncharacterized protein n=1 Tax=Xanthocytophaga agilis TaxID=3048010 RepID=A0AAE3R2M3_9BACT|nr:hypothetical protein [Xanthocytophaga agilis]MDJ1502706.1 hypothetical protein [Xanthocytophaga agilis]
MASRNINTYFILATLIAILPVVIPFLIQNIVETDGALLMFLMIYTWLAGILLMLLGISAIALARKEKHTIWVGLSILSVGLLRSAYIVKEVFLSI